MLAPYFQPGRGSFVFYKSVLDCTSGKTKQVIQSTSEANASKNILTVFLILLDSEEHIRMTRRRVGGWSSVREHSYMEVPLLSREPENVHIKYKFLEDIRPVLSRCTSSVVGVVIPAPIDFEVRFSYYLRLHPVNVLESTTARAMRPSLIKDSRRYYARICRLQSAIAKRIRKEPQMFMVSLRDLIIGDVSSESFKRFEEFGKGTSDNFPRGNEYLPDGLTLRAAVWAKAARSVAFRIQRILTDEYPDHPSLWKSYFAPNLIPPELYFPPIPMSSELGTVVPKVEDESPCGYEGVGKETPTLPARTIKPEEFEATASPACDRVLRLPHSTRRVTPSPPQCHEQSSPSSIVSVPCTPLSINGLNALVQYELVPEALSPVTTIDLSSTENSPAHSELPPFQCLPSPVPINSEDERIPVVTFKSASPSHSENNNLAVRKPIYYLGVRNGFTESAFSRALIKHMMTNLRTCPMWSQ